jgi:hypothetical protein
MEHEYPLLYAPRPMPKVIGATDDARWRGIHQSTRQINMARVHEMQLQSRKRKVVGVKAAKA